MPERPEGYHGDETALYGTRDETDMQHWGREKDSGAGRMPVTRTLPRERGRVKQRSHETDGQRAGMQCMSSSMKSGPVPMGSGSRAHMKEWLGGGGAADTYNQGPA